MPRRYLCNWSDPPRHDVDLSDRRRLRLALRDASAFAQRYCEVAVVETERAADRSKSARFKPNKTEAWVVEHTETHDHSLAVRRTDTPPTPAIEHNDDGKTVGEGKKR